MSPTVWLVTGSTSGLGAALVDHILSRGDQVIASGRKVNERLAHLKSNPNAALLELDIAAGKEELLAKIQAAWQIFGRIDVLMNNAGISATRSVEDAGDDYVQNMFQVNLFGQMYLTQAILPLLRAQGHGCIAFTASSSSWMALPFMSHYAMTKAALDVFAETLHREISPLGLRAVAFDCGAFPTRLMHPREESQKADTESQEPAIDDYKPLYGDLMSVFTTDPMGLMIGDPTKAASTIFDVVKAEGVAASKTWAVRVVLGSDSLDSAKQRRQGELKLLSDWESVSRSTDGNVYKRRDDLQKFTVVTGAEV
ncbi:Oxidoreductase BOA17-like protein [Cladobotryum mycophilum]|uniref:Oxidoreductase BOA17-like protein n=1 Tax=Cladobotryum mycophilum TaxID=491253 RepID=A0ABR0S841_9HYPO